jgi:hypothetical protein
MGRGVEEVWKRRERKERKEVISTRHPLSTLPLSTLPSLLNPRPPSIQ